MNFKELLERTKVIALTEDEDIFKPAFEKRITEEKAGKENITKIGLSGLKAEARKYETFEEFEQAWLGQIKHGLYWHITYAKDFKIDPEKGPMDMSSMSAGKIDKGKLMITSHLEYWAEGYTDEEETGGKPRGYTALIDMSNVPKDKYHQVKRGFGNEFFVEDPSMANVIDVVPIEKALELDAIYGKAKPQSSAELRKLYDEAWTRSRS